MYISTDHFVALGDLGRIEVGPLLGRQIDVLDLAARLQLLDHPHLPLVVGVLGRRVLLLGQLGQLGNLVELVLALLAQLAASLAALAFLALFFFFFENF